MLILITKPLTMTSTVQLMIILKIWHNQHAIRTMIIPLLAKSYDVHILPKITQKVENVAFYGQTFCTINQIYVHYRIFGALCLSTTILNLVITGRFSASSGISARAPKQAI